MKIKEEYSIRKVGDEEVLISHQSEGTDFSRVMVLNPSAACLIRETEHRPFDAKQWAESLVVHYGIDRERAEADAEQVIAKLRREQVIE